MRRLSQQDMLGIAFMATLVVVIVIILLMGNLP